MMLLFTNKINKKHCKISGILRWDVSCIITDFTFPVDRSNKKNNIGTITEIIKI